MKRDKRVVVISDTHCGHKAGLTPPEYALALAENQKHDKFALIEAVTWDWFYREAVKVRPCDVLLLNGDAIDGRGEKSGGVELLTTDRGVQAAMAENIIKLFQPKHVVLTTGTGYHVSSDGEEWEEVIASRLNDSFSGDVAVGAHEWFEVNGVTFDAKHHLAMSTAPQSQYTALARDAVWKMLWQARGEAPNADIILRSHVHTFLHIRCSDYAAYVTPGLQAYSRYGAKRVSRHIDYGFLHFDVSKGGNWSCTEHLARFAELKPLVLKY